MTSEGRGFRFRGNDGEWWIPAFAGMTENGGFPLSGMTSEGRGFRFRRNDGSRGGDSAFGGMTENGGFPLCGNEGNGGFLLSRE
jgi:hypothetical protein